MEHTWTVSVSLVNVRSRQLIWPDLLETALSTTKGRRDAVREAPFCATCLRTGEQRKEEVHQEGARQAILLSLLVCLLRILGFSCTQVTVFLLKKWPSAGHDLISQGTSTRRGARSLPLRFAPRQVLG